MQSENICTEKLPIRSRATGLLDWTEQKQIETPMLVPFCFSWFKSFSQKHHWHGRLYGVMCHDVSSLSSFKTSKRSNWPGGQ